MSSNNDENKKIEMSELLVELNKVLGDFVGIKLDENINIKLNESYNNLIEGNLSDNNIINGGDNLKKFLNELLNQLNNFNEKDKSDNKPRARLNNIIEKIKTIHQSLNNSIFKNKDEELMKSVNEIINLIMVDNNNEESKNGKIKITDDMKELIRGLFQLQVKIVIYRLIKMKEETQTGIPQELLKKLIEPLNKKVQAMNEFYDSKYENPTISDIKIEEQKGGSILPNSTGYMNRLLDLDNIYKYAKYRIKYILLKNKKH